MLALPTVKAATELLMRGPASLADLVGDLNEAGFTGATVAATRDLLHASPRNFTFQDGCWQLAAPGNPIGLQPQPRPSYPPARRRLNYTWLTTGRLGPIAFGDFNRRLQETLALAPYAGLLFELPASVDARGIPRAWRMHRIWHERNIAFVFWTISDSPPMKQFLADRGWHLWHPEGAGEWSDDRELLTPGELDALDVVPATWLSPTANDAANRVGEWFSDQLKMAGLAGTQIRVLSAYHSATELASRAQRRRSAATHQGRKDPIRGSCRACGQPLSDPESLARGYGPECYDSRTAGATSALTPTDEYYATAPTLNEWRELVLNAMRLPAAQRRASGGSTTEGR